MKFKFLFLLLIAGALFACKSQTQKTAQPKVVYIIVDGIPTDVVNKLDLPTLKAIAASSNENGFAAAHVGGDSGSYNQTPTISAPGYMDLLTGTWGNKHNVWDNDNQSPNYHYQNLFRVVETQKPDLNTAVFSTWLDNRTVLIGEGQANAGNFKIDYAFDGFEKDTLRFPHDSLSRYIANIDELVATEAARYIAEQAPDLSWVYLEYTDDMGHRYGDSEQFYESIRQADRQLGLIWEAVKKRRQMGEDWLIVVTTDHGRDASTGMEHGDQSPRERATWICTNAKGLNARFRSKNLAITDIYPVILQHLCVKAPENVRAENDGVPFVGPLSIGNIDFSSNNGIYQLQWEAIDPSESIEVWISFNNNFKSGAIDEYIKIGTYSGGKAILQFSPEQEAAFQKSKFAKVLLKGKNNWNNAWLQAKVK